MVKKLGRSPQPTSGESGSCREAGEKPVVGKDVLPLGDQVEQLARSAQQQFPLRAAELLRRDGAQEAVAGRAGMALLDLLAAQGQRGTLRSQPSQKAPDRAVVQTSGVGDIVVGVWGRLVLGR